MAGAAPQRLPAIADGTVETRFKMSSPQFGEEQPLRRHLPARLQWPSEQTIGPLRAEKPELAANPG
jgi:hypothetical protein